MDRIPDRSPPDLSRALSNPSFTDAFRDGSSLVDTASHSLARIAEDLDAMRGSIVAGMPASTFEHALASICRHIQAATASGDNLLGSPDGKPTSVPLGRALSRDRSGAIALHEISIDRSELAMIGTCEKPGALDRLMDALARSTEAPGMSPEFLSALENMSNHVAAAISRLSIAKGRLDLQSSFLAAVAGADIAPKVDSTLDARDARVLALETRRMLSGRSLDIGNRNRRVLQDLFARETPPRRD